MFVQCRGCNQTVPGSMAACQFCGTSLAGVAPPAAKASIWHDDTNPGAYSYSRPKWIPLAYNLVAAYIGISGLINMATSGVAMSRAKDDIGQFIAGIGIAFGLIYLIVGIGLLLRIEWIRGVVNFVCGWGLIWGIFRLFVFVPALLFGGWGVLLVLQEVLGIVTNAAMIYLVGETD